MNKDKTRIGVIGVGHLGEYHVQKYIAMPGVELVGVADTDSGRVAEIGERYKTRAYGEYHKILNEVDGVSLAVPTEVHFEVAKDVLSHGVHLLIEKPITYQLETADTLIRMADERGLILQVGLVERFNPAVVKMESLINRPVLIESHRMNVFNSRGLDVDVVLDLMIHDLDIILHVVPSKVKDVHAVGMSVVTDKTDIANARIIFENGIVANLTASRVSDKTLRKIRVFQPDAHLSVNCARREFTVIRLDSNVNEKIDCAKLASEKMEFPGSDPLADEIASFVNVINNGAKPVVTGRDGRDALKLALDIIDQIERR